MRKSNNTLKIMMVIAAMTLSWQAYAAGALVAGDVINVDFSSYNNTGSLAGWNVVAGTGGSVADAVTANGDSTGVSVSIPNSFDADSFKGTTSPDPALGFPVDATSDYLWGQNDSTAQVLFSNLDPSLIYQLTIFGSRADQSDIRETQYAVSGAGGLIETLYLNASSNNDKVVTTQVLSPTASGEITIDIQKGPNNNSGGGYYYLNVMVLKAVDNYLPYNQAPAVGAEVDVTQTLSWAQASSVSGQGVYYDVYLGTDPNVLSPTYYGLAPVKTTTTDPADFFYTPSPDLVPDAAYYWRVDALEPNALNPGTYTAHTGPEWMFTTLPAVARIDVNPVGQLVGLGTAVDFTVEGVNITQYQWYKDGIALSDATDTKYIGENSATLTVLNVQQTDEGDYYCEVDNDLNQPAVSEIASLMTKRMVGWWKLDGDLTDSIGEIYPSALAHDGTSVDPTYVAGKDGSCVEFNNSIDDTVVLENSSDFFNFYPNGYSVSVWVKEPAASVYANYVSKHATDYSTGFAVIHDTVGRPFHRLRQGFYLNSGVYVDDDAWHLVTATYDGAAKEGKIYIDGLLATTGTHSAVIDTNDSDVVFGANWPDNVDRLYTGQLDDIRIYSYPLDAYEVAHLYTEFNPGTEICLDYPALDTSGPEGVKDCRVDIYDILSLAADWLECNIVPDCTQP